MAILKLYELRRDEQMRIARGWYFTDFAAESAMDIVTLYRGGERASANFRMVTSYWDAACSFVLNGGIDAKMFFDANKEHILVYAKVGPFLAEIREMFGEPDYLIHLENLVRSLPDFAARMESRRRLISIWSPKPA